MAHRFAAQPLLALAISMAFGTAPLYLQAAETTQAQTYRFDIAGQSLDGALAAFSAVTRIQVLVSGELEGNIESASLVELRDSAVLTGDLKAGSLTVASGSKIRGHIECGWGDAKPGPTPTGNAKDKAANDKSSD